MQQLGRLIWIVALCLAGSTLAHAKSAQQDHAKLHMLNQGYSLLYADASGLSKADKLFAIKFENDATEKVVTATSDYLAKLTGQLEQLAHDYPSLRLDLQPLPKITQKTKAAANRARIESFAPVVGRTGPDFERTLLLTLSGGLNQTRHLAQVLAEAERSDQRRQFLKTAEHHMDQHYDAILKVLNAHYFTHPQAH